jgi:hypothetical protein
MIDVREQVATVTARITWQMREFALFAFINTNLVEIYSKVYSERSWRVRRG